ncbi:site-2 protease family protein [Peribacillus cavernae]|uniref:Site-2 protease family protein n=1 Tax=Peribacillus cavernae TaxID=1674310 RepID=A0A3S0U738_9BACI|nr:site-2 protease family protein [Peribacillus cavernae]MDQ0218551.1 Zn-dependent protease [Peribacillus cavernae]RUQ31541.1 site-2 protease family protein [Peribacillus cavernae]
MENFLNRYLAYDLEKIPYVIVVLLIAFTVHEFSHAYVAYRFGDPTAKNEGRITLNPIHHIDPLGTLLLLIAGFGWARPVPVNRFHFKRPRLAGVLVSFAGPLSNLLLAIAGLIIWYSLVAAGLGVNMPVYVYTFIDMFIQINIVLFVFNMLPFPALDGYRILQDLVPANVRAKMTQYEAYGVLIFLILIITPLYQYTIQPIFQIVLPFVINGLNDFFAQLFL